MDQILQIAVFAAGGLLASAAVLVALRLGLGPTLADRALALDLLGFVCVALVAVIVLWSGETALFDSAMALALIAFLATVALARFAVHMDGRSGPGGAEPLKLKPQENPGDLDDPSERPTPSGPSPDPGGRSKEISGEPHV